MPQTAGTLAAAVNEGTLVDLYTWGAAAAGRLANGTTTPDVTSPAFIYASQWKSVALGNNHTAAIKHDGSLWTVGGNASYQLGHGDTTQRTSFTRVGADSDWKVVSAGGAATAAIKNNGTLWSCGNNANYRTGQGTNSGTTNTMTQIGSDTDWAFVSIGSQTMFAIKTNGDLYTCGNNVAYVTAQGTNTGDTTTLTKSGSSTWSMANCGERDANGTAVAAVGADGKAYSWGNNTNYATAQGTNTGFTTSPTTFNTDTDWTDAACCAYNGSGIKGGKLYTWGVNQAYRTGQGTTTGSTTTETQVGSATTWEGRSLLQQQAGFAVQDGGLYSWGLNTNGRTGQGTSTGNTTSPTQIGSDTTWTTEQFHSASGSLITHGLALKS
jgi:alpha-tubulin suppressor-like RCC1 family protein